MERNKNIKNIEKAMSLEQKHHQEQTQDLHQIQGQVQEIDTKLDQILGLLIGNELDKEAGGMIKTVKSHEARLESLEKVISNLKWFLIGLSFFAGWGVIDLIQKLVLKQN